MPATLITIKVREEVTTVKVVPFEGWQISKQRWNWMTHVQKKQNLQWKFIGSSKSKESDTVE